MEKVLLNRVLVGPSQGWHQKCSKDSGAWRLHADISGLTPEQVHPDWELVICKKDHQSLSLKNREDLLNGIRASDRWIFPFLPWTILCYSFYSFSFLIQSLEWVKAPVVSVQVFSNFWFSGGICPFLVSTYIWKEFSRKTKRQPKVCDSWLLESLSGFPW